MTAESSTARHFQPLEEVALQPDGKAVIGGTVLSKPVRIGGARVAHEVAAPAPAG